MFIERSAMWRGRAVSRRRDARGAASVGRVRALASAAPRARFGCLGTPCVGVDGLATRRARSGARSCPAATTARPADMSRRSRKGWAGERRSRADAARETLGTGPGGGFRARDAGGVRGFWVTSDAPTRASHAAPRPTSIALAPLPSLTPFFFLCLCSRRAAFLLLFSSSSFSLIPMAPMAVSSSRSAAPSLHASTPSVRRAPPTIRSSIVPLSPSRQRSSPAVRQFRSLQAKALLAGRRLRHLLRPSHAHLAQAPREGPVDVSAFVVPLEAIASAKGAEYTGLDALPVPYVWNEADWEELDN